jgi:hypothetical protein
MIDKLLIDNRLNNSFLQIQRLIDDLNLLKNKFWEEHFQFALKHLQSDDCTENQLLLDFHHDA